MQRNKASAATVALVALAGMAIAQTAEMPAVVRKPSVDVHASPDFNAPTIAKLNRDAAVKIAGQQGLWFRLNMPASKAGYVRVNDVRMAYSGKENSDANMRALFTGKAGKGRVSETASVRGIDESDLQSAGFDAAQLARLEGYRLTPDAAAAHARASGWTDSAVPYALESKPAPAAGRKQSTQGQKRAGLSAARGLLSRIGGNVGSNAGSVIDVADKAVPKSEQELAEEELALGPQIAGRILGAAPLWKDDAAQRRVNQIGRWIASHTSRPELPWTFGIIDDAEVNAFAAPGGYVLITRGLYNLLADDGEVAAVLGHEISHAVQRDHYEVIRKQEMTAVGTNIAASHVNVGGGIAGSYAKAYAQKHGAKIALARLDREAEFRSDEAAEIYLARSGFNPLSMYMVLQKMTALGTASAKLAQLYKTHPPLADRLDRIDRRAYAGLERYTQR